MRPTSSLQKSRQLRFPWVCSFLHIFSAVPFSHCVRSSYESEVRAKSNQIIWAEYRCRLWLNIKACEFVALSVSLQPVSRQRPSIILVFWFILVTVDCPMIQQWYELTCSYLWNGMLIGRTRRLKHRRNGGERSQRWSNIYGARHLWALPSPPHQPQTLKTREVFIHLKVLSEQTVRAVSFSEIAQRDEVCQEEGGWGNSSRASHVWLLWCDSAFKLGNNSDTTEIVVSKQIRRFLCGVKMLNVLKLKEISGFDRSGCLKSEKHSVIKTKAQNKVFFHAFFFACEHCVSTKFVLTDKISCQVINYFLAAEYLWLK